MNISQHCECLERLRAEYDAGRKAILRQIDEISNEARDINKKVMVIESKMIELQENHKCEYSNAAMHSWGSVQTSK